MQASLDLRGLLFSALLAAALGGVAACSGLEISNASTTPLSESFRQATCGWLCRLPSGIVIAA